MQLVLGKMEMNEFTENECLTSLELNHSHAKVLENALTLTLKGFLYFRTGAAHKNRKRLVLFR